MSRYWRPHPDSFRIGTRQRSHAIKKNLFKRWDLGLAAPRSVSVQKETPTPDSPPPVRRRCQLKKKSTSAVGLKSTYFCPASLVAPFSARARHPRSPNSSAIITLPAFLGSPQKGTTPRFHVRIHNSHIIPRATHTPNFSKKNYKQLHNNYPRTPSVLAANVARTRSVYEQSNVHVKDSVAPCFVNRNGDRFNDSTYR
jgi:hypothetical protein